MLPRSIIRTLTLKPNQVLSRSVIPLSSLDAFRPHETDDIRLDLQLQDGTAF